MPVCILYLVHRSKGLIRVAYEFHPVNFPVLEKDLCITAECFVQANSPLIVLRVKQSLAVACYINLVQFIV